MLMSGLFYVRLQYMKTICFAQFVKFLTSSKNCEGEREFVLVSF